MSVPSTFLESKNARFIVLDPEQPTAIAKGLKPSCSQTVLYPAGALSTSSLSFQKVSLTSFISKLPCYNICDFEAWQGLTNNYITISGITVQILPGNYSATSLATYLSSLIDVTTGNVGALVIYNSDRLLFEFTGTYAYTIEIPTNGPLIELGLNTGIVYNSPFASDYAPDLTAPVDLLIHINELSGGTPMTYNGTSFLFQFPLLSTTPGLSQMSPYYNQPKTQAWTPVSQRMVQNLTVSLWFTHKGTVYPFYVEGTRPDKPVGGYSMVLVFE